MKTYNLIMNEIIKISADSTEIINGNTVFKIGNQIVVEISGEYIIENDSTSETIDRINSSQAPKTKP